MTAPADRAPRQQAEHRVVEAVWKRKLLIEQLDNGEWMLEVKYWRSGKWHNWTAVYPQYFATLDRALGSVRTQTGSRDNR